MRINEVAAACWYCYYRIVQTNCILVVKSVSHESRCQQVQCLMWSLGCCIFPVSVSSVATQMLHLSSLCIQCGTLDAASFREEGCCPHLEEDARTPGHKLSVKLCHKCINLFMKEKLSGSSDFLKTPNPSVISCWQDLTFGEEQLR